MSNVNKEALEFVKLAGQVGELVQTELQKQAADTAAAKVKAAEVLKSLTQANLIPADQAKEASDLLATHGGTLDLMQNFAELWTRKSEVKSASSQPFAPVKPEPSPRYPGERRPDAHAAATAAAREAMGL